MRAPVLALILVGCGSSPATLTDATALVDPCDACGADTQCVQLYDGTCGARGVQCVARVDGCTVGACEDACNTAYCQAQGPQYSCEAGPCGGESPTGFACYGY